MGFFSYRLALNRRTNYAKPTFTPGREPRRLNLRGTVEKARARAGLTEWPRLMQNLRSSRETELVEQFPAHLVAYWLNLSTRMAERHYL